VNPPPPLLSHCSYKQKHREFTYSNAKSCDLTHPSIKWITKSTINTDILQGDITLADVVLCTCRIYPTVNTSDRPRLIVITIRTIITRNPTMASIKATNKIIADTVRENKLNSNLH
jgi:hypothetical protein